MKTGWSKIFGEWRKIFNVAQYVITHLQGNVTRPAATSFRFEDKWIKSRLSNLNVTVSVALDNYDFHDAAQALYRFTNDDFCDWYVEFAKSTFEEESYKSKETKNTSIWVFREILKLSHPVMPYITEKLWKLNSKV